MKNKLDIDATLDNVMTVFAYHGLDLGSAAAERHTEEVRAILSNKGTVAVKFLKISQEFNIPLSDLEAVYEKGAAAPSIEPWKPKTLGPFKFTHQAHFSPALLKMLRKNNKNVGQPKPCEQEFYVTRCPIAFGHHVTISFFGENNLTLIETNGNMTQPSLLIWQPVDSEIQTESFSSSESAELVKKMKSLLPKGMLKVPIIREMLASLKLRAE